MSVFNISGSGGVARRVSPAQPVGLKQDKRTARGVNGSAVRSAAAHTCEDSVIAAFTPSYQLLPDRAGNRVVTYRHSVDG